MESVDGINYIQGGNENFSVIFLTRIGGVSSPPYNGLNMSYAAGDDKSAVDMNYGKVFHTLGITPERLIRINQVHGNGVLIIKRSKAEQGGTGDYDAVVTDDPSLCLSVLTADCVPIFLYDPAKGVFSAVHAGWRGTALNVAGKAVNAMINEFQCSVSDIRASVGPAIALCCYTVGGDVLERFAATLNADIADFSRVESGQIHIDLKRANVIQLKDCGIDEASIEVSEHCTSCESDLFFSYRRENVTGRQMSLINYKEA